MKCENCGADYLADLQFCPFCHTVNPEWFTRQAKEQELEHKKEQTVRKVRRQFATIWRDSLCSRFLTGAIMLFVGLIAAVFIAAFIMEGSGSLSRKIHIDKYERQMEEYYQAGEYGQLYAYMSDKELTGTDYYAYTQAGLMYSYMQNYRISAYELLDDMKDDGHIRSDSDIWSVMHYASQVIKRSGVYEKIDTRNQALFDEYSDEIRTYVRTYLKLTDEELEAYVNYEMTSSDGIALILERTGVICDEE